MIRNSFLHLTGISMKLESELWNRGIETWEDFERNLDYIRTLLPPVFFEEELPGEIEEAKKNYAEKNVRYFWDRFPYSEAWRLYGDFPELFWGLDIETTGIGYPNRVTCICVSNGKDTYQFTRTRNLEAFYDFWESINQGIIVTYNGFRFDIPFLKRDMQWVPPIPHMDLMHTLHRMNIKGGLKGSEERLGIERKKELQGLTGNQAVELWNLYLETDIEDYLMLLEEYNQEDTVNLIRILDIVYKQKVSKIFPVQRNLF